MLREMRTQSEFWRHSARAAPARRSGVGQLRGFFGFGREGEWGAGEGIRMSLHDEGMMVDGDEVEVRCSLVMLESNWT